MAILGVSGGCFKTERTNYSILSIPYFVSFFCTFEKGIRLLGDLLDCLNGLSLPIVFLRLVESLSVMLTA